MTAPNPKLSLTFLAACLALSGCSDPKTSLQEKVAQAEAAAQRAEAAAAKAEKALADMESKPSEAPTMVDGGPQLTPEPPPQPMVQSAQEEAPPAEAPAPQ